MLNGVRVLGGFVMALFIVDRGSLVACAVPMAAVLGRVVGWWGVDVAVAQEVPMCAGVPATIVDDSGFTRGTDGPDVIVAVGEVWGLAGDDLICTVGGRPDEVRGGAGDDEVYAGAGRDSVLGNGGNDSLFGENGSDLLNGGAGHDVVDGGAIGDSLYGGFGNDNLVGETA